MKFHFPLRDQLIKETAELKSELTSVEEKIAQVKETLVKLQKYEEAACLRQLQVDFLKMKKQYEACDNDLFK